MTTLADFLLAQVDADQAAARAAIRTSRPDWKADRYLIVTDDDFCVAEGNVKTAAHIARHDPARVLAEVASKRVIVALHVDYGRVVHDPTSPLADKDGYYMTTGGECGECRDGMTGPCDTLRHLAAPYSSEPGFDPAWAI